MLIMVKTSTEQIVYLQAPLSSGKNYVVRVKETYACLQFFENMLCRDRQDILHFGKDEIKDAILDKYLPQHNNLADHSNTCRTVATT